MYVRIHVSIKQLSYVCYEIKKIQHSTLDIIDNENILIHQFNQEWFTATMLELCLFIIFSLANIYMRVKAYIKCYLCWIRTVIEYKSNTINILPTTMLEFLLNFNSSVTTIYNKVIADIQCQIIFTFWWVVSTSEKIKYFGHLWYNLCFHTIVDTFLLWHKENSELNVS